MDDDGDDKDDTKRRTRNLSEKKRRDQFNMLVNELSAMVSTNNRKMDKSTVLKSTISFLKNHNEITVRSRAHDVQEDWKPAFLSNEEFTYLVLEALEGFVMVFSATGQIYYVSESITSLLGHNPADVVNKSIFDLACEDDRPSLYNLLQNPGSATDPMHAVGKENEIRFQCHLKRGSLDFRDETTYELIQFNGHFRTNMEPLDSDDMPSYNPDHESRLLFVCTGRLYTPQLIRDVSLVDSSRSEFTSRHSLEWKFLFLDHRAPPIIGYLPFEVLGTSGYDYYHFDDLEKVVTCHEALMQKGELTSCYYRFLTKGQQWIWLQTRFYITYHQWNSKPEFVVCTHRVVSYADIAKSMKQEGAEADTVSEAEVNRGVMKEAPSDDAMVSMSPSYMSEASDAFGTSSYQPLSQVSPASVKSASAGSTTGTVATAGTAATAGASWTRASHVHFTGSDTGSLSGESRSSQRNSMRENYTFLQTHKSTEAAPAPQHGIGAQYLDPAPYVSAVGVPGVLPLSIPPLPVIVSPDQAQMQEQLQRKHEELQQMIVRQQEELRQVKEQLLLARLGILQPLINVQGPYVNPEDMQQNQRLPAQIVYEAGTPRAAITGYPQQHPPHAGGHHPHMPQ
ncbi:circadian locomoter output cycles protein kaput-like isoform X1 [Spodoptera litura]|uniref:Circadian locomoter output cycles protein kaput-like isoform X1 n=2 Tax=Spodoptera litura TaxID=69820 RepID=A0A9J7EM71_SPOLT|nr:circadian locomoter output cycles protein kaput-like isoform X1 [Spodoptera litura]XP_022833223.1 circadian locomoter output cycles protein kaput-like isoform X1 [Spodoptera litura]XP_022833224.1 circadian locomoter output cycles protein kaput-like isoform X1 [Spodoptera litura]